MRTIDEALQDFIETSSIVKEKSLSEEDCKQLTRDYLNSMKKVLLDNGYIQVSDQVRLDIVRLKKRVHVLRGQSYVNHREFKLKTRIGYPLYQEISESFKDMLVGN